MAEIKIEAGEESEAISQYEYETNQPACASFQ